MRYTTEEMRTLIEFHRKYNSMKKTNYYLDYLEKLEEECPDIQGEIEEMMFEYDDDAYLDDPEEEARAFAIGMLNEWIGTLEAVRDRLKG
ncbi:MAG: hypothetical protein H6559_37830 [Lewinellaceae bacterium]|nr:hypothetical protein [Lewinellaceae bacterium]